METEWEGKGNCNGSVLILWRGLHISELRCDCNCIDNNISTEEVGNEM